MLRRLALNSASNLVKLFVSIAVTFVMAPFYLEMMGFHDYGLREMVIALIGYMGMIDLGMRPTMSRFSSKYNAQNDRQALNAVYACSIVFMLVVGFLIAIFFWCWAAFYPEILVKGENSEPYKYALFLLAVGVQVLFAFPRFVTESFLEGFQFYFFKNTFEIIEIIALSVLSYIFMTPRNALILLTGLVVMFSAIKLIVFGAVLATRKFGGLYPNIFNFEWPKLKEMLDFGLKSFIQGAAHTVETMSDRFVIGALLGPSSVPMYTIPYTLVGYIGSITGSLSHAFMPFFADLDAGGRRGKIKPIYLSASKMAVGLAVPMGAGISIIGAPFVEVWMNGQLNSQTVDAIILLFVLYKLTPLLDPFATRFLTAINEHGIFAKVAPVAALANLGLSVWAVIEFGVIGAALGSVLPVLVVTPIYLKYSCFHLGVSMIHYVRICVLPAAIPTSLMISTVLWLRLEWGLTDYSRILVAITAGATVYVFAFWLIAMNEEERTWLLSRMPFKRKRF